jgi:spermidine/putrescine transport system ATP-binding protein
MRDIRLVNVSKAFGKEAILNNYNLTVPAGNFFVLLGPSGCGKTTILRLIAGFEQADRGRIFLGDQDITDLAPNERNINTVFQNYALFPHLNVFDNVAYSLKIKRVAPDEIAERVVKILGTVHLEKQIYKRIDQLSGGQQQRVALARAIINEPDVLLLDEPLAALDLKLREKVLVELIELQEKLRTTFIYITHDQDEALVVADRMAIMNHQGQIEQIGGPDEIYDRPRTAFVANFVGQTNLIKGTLREDAAASWSVQLDRLDLDMPALESWVKPELEGCKLKFSLRPEKLILQKERTVLVGYENYAQGQVISVIYHGKSTLYRVQMAEDLILQVFEQSRSDVVELFVGDVVWAAWRSLDAVLLQD